MISIPRRVLTFEIEGKQFKAKELSAFYLAQAITNPELDSTDNAIKDSMGDIPEEDLKLFGIDTKNIIYQELVKFTFKETLDKDQVKEIAKVTGLKEAEVKSLSASAQVELKNLIDARQPPDTKKNGTF